MQTLIFHTKKKTYGPFRREDVNVEETKFKSDYGKFVGFFGNGYDSWLDQIGCFIVPSILTSPTLWSITL